ncbi:MAG: hypothetical protein AB1341_04425 [Bacillota bacterium]
MNREGRSNQREDDDPKIFRLFATERMEDYIALSLALVIVITVLLIHQ